MPATKSRKLPPSPMFPIPKEWGTNWGDVAHINYDGLVIRLYRGRYNRCRWLTNSGEQVGPVLNNVVPAICWAYRNGFIDPTAGSLNYGCMVECGYYRKGGAGHRKAKAS